MPNQECFEDEIDLREFVKVVLKRKKIVLTVFFTAMVAAVIVIFTAPKIYETTSLIQIDRIDDLLINKQEMKEFLLSGSFLKPVVEKLNFVTDPKELSNKIDQVRASIKIDDIIGTDLAKIRVQYPDREKATKLCETIINDFLRQSRPFYQKRLSYINDRIEGLDARIKETKDAIKKTQELFTQLAHIPNISDQERILRGMILQNLLLNYDIHLNSLMGQKDELNKRLMDSSDFKIIDFPLMPDTPIKPKKRQILAIASILGLVLGIFAALFQEHWEKGRKEMPK